MSATAVSQARSWLGYESPEISARWDLRDVLTYALAVGADPKHDPSYLDEAAGPRMLPTFATFAAGPWVPHLHRTIWAKHPGGVAAGLAYRVHRPVPVVGQAATRVRVTGYEVKPSALLVWLTATTTGPDGPLLSGRHCVLFRGGGDRESVGEAGPWPDSHPQPDPHPQSGSHLQAGPHSTSGPQPQSGPFPGGDAWLTAAVRIDPRAIQLYRLLLPLVAGQPGPDPLHADAGASASAGLGPPTLHGVAVLGHVGLALARMLGDRIGGVSAFGARFRRPVHPGDTLAVSANRARPGAVWALRATDEAGQDVLDQAWIEIIEENP